MTMTVDNKCGFSKYGGHTVKEWIFFGKDKYIPEVFIFQAMYRPDKVAARGFELRHPSIA